jgi:uncharacterized protein (UPF0335 family)
MATLTAVAEKHPAQLEYEKAHGAHMKANSVLEGFISRQGQLEQEISALNAEYDRACESAAGGSGVDPQPVQAQLQGKQHLLRGTQALRQKAEEATKPLAEAATEASRRLRETNWATELAELEEAVKAADAEAKGAHEAEVRAVGRLSDAVRKKDSFRKMIERQRGESLLDPQSPAR